RASDFADVMGLALPAQRTIHDLLVNLILPSVDHVYVNHMRDMRSTVRNVMDGRGLDISIDGRYDSPGYSATNCTVSTIDLKTNLIIMVVNMHKRMRGIEGKSGRMEKEGVREGLKRIAALVYKLEKKKSCPNIQFWRRKIINHAYFVHLKYARNRARGLNYWMSVLPHVTGRHSHFQKIPFLNGISKCKHTKLGRDTTHLIKRDSDEYQELKAVILKTTFLSGFLRASPKKNTSPNECFNSIINMYAPKKNASTPPWYEERVKLATLHFNNLSLLNMLNLREERYDTSVKVIGRGSRAVKRKMAKVDHAWRREVR
ncbi:hypothetical protein PENTCL1PPCAC_30173, partial [Pristionchus entomophagus]